MGFSRREVFATRQNILFVIMDDVCIDQMRLVEDPPEFRQAYAQLLLWGVAVKRKEFRVNGIKSVLDRCASTYLSGAASTVLLFVLKWRSLRDKTDNWEILLRH